MNQFKVGDKVKLTKFNPGGNSTSSQLLSALED